MLLPDPWAIRAALRVGPFLLLVLAPMHSGAKPAVGPVTIPLPADAVTRRLHVSQHTGSDETGDGSAAKPWASLRHALSRCGDASSARRYHVLVAAARYVEGPLEMKRYVDLYGGFEPSNWERDLLRYATTLDGGQTGRVIVGANHARLDGFTIRDGRVRGPGGAILCDRTSSTITNNTILYNETLEPEGYNHDLLHQAGHDGGAIACLNGAAPVIANNAIAHNATGVGGGGGIASLNYSTPTIENNVLSDNVTGRTDRNRSRSSNGAAISCSNLPIKVVDRQRVRHRISGNVILNNRVGGNSDAGGIYCEYDAHPEISRNLILGNVAEDDGGGIYVMKSSEPLIAANVIAGSRGGGAIRLSKEGRALIENNLLFANDPGSITCANSWMRLVHNTIVADVGNGLSYENQSQHLRHSAVIGNLFHGKTASKWRHSPAGSLTVTHNLLEGGRAEDGNIDADPQFEDDAWAGEASRAAYDRQRVRTTVTLSAPPPHAERLVGRPVRAGDRWGVIASVDGPEIIVWGDLTAGQPTGPLRIEVPPTYRLRAGSPCIDQGPPTGNPADDIDGDARPADGSTRRPDIGADEFRG
jgi:parallel beta-helix repeat protein